MAGQHHQRNGHELGQNSGGGGGQRGLACCSPWGRKGSDMTGRLNDDDTPTCNRPNTSSGGLAKYAVGQGW